MSRTPILVQVLRDTVNEGQHIELSVCYDESSLKNVNNL